MGVYQKERVAMVREVRCETVKNYYRNCGKKRNTANAVGRERCNLYTICNSLTPAHKFFIHSKKKLGKILPRDVVNILRHILYFQETWRYNNEHSRISYFTLKAQKNPLSMIL